MTEHANNADTQEHSNWTRRFSPALLVAGLAALAVALWGIAGGPSPISAGTLVGILAIGAVAAAGVVLIARPHGCQAKRR